EVDAHGLVEVGQTLFQVVDEVDAAFLGLDDRELAELDARARHDLTTERTRVDLETFTLQRGGDRGDLILVDVEDDELLVDGRTDAVRTVCLDDLGHTQKRASRDPADLGRKTDVELSVALAVYPHVVAAYAFVQHGGGPVGQGVTEVFLLQDLAELLRAPFLDEVLQTGAVAQPAKTVVTKDRGDPRPDIAHLVRPYEGAQPFGEHRVGGQATADEQVVAHLTVLVAHPHERHVVDLVVDAVDTASGEGGLVLAWQVRKKWAADVLVVDLFDLLGGVDDLVIGHTGQRATENDTRGVTAGLGGGQPHRFELLPDGGNVLDPDPVVLDVLPVGDVRGVAAVVTGDLGDRAQLGDRQLAAVDTHSHHEVAVVEFLGPQDGGLSTVDARGALGVQTEPAEASTQVGRVDGVEPGLGVDVDDPIADVEPVVVLLVLLVLVQRLAVAEGPLAISATTPRLDRRGGLLGLSRRGRHRGCLRWGRGALAARAPAPTSRRLRTSSCSELRVGSVCGIRSRDERRGRAHP